ncbi:hypothetical protein JTB14_018671 [Gonioctena quinquepunctata]|nr:hypothetical protein JTB14_018671 [Gonioctena quinquepunctata]
MQIRKDENEGTSKTSREFDVESFVDSPTNSMFDSELIDKNVGSKYSEDARADNYSNIIEQHEIFEEILEADVEKIRNSVESYFKENNINSTMSMESRNRETIIEIETDEDR